MFLFSGIIPHFKERLKCIAIGIVKEYLQHFKIIFRRSSGPREGLRLIFSSVEKTIFYDEFWIVELFERI